MEQNTLVLLVQLCPSLKLFIFIFFGLAVVGSGVTTRAISDAAEKLANVSIGSGRGPTKQPVFKPMKAGGWHGHQDLFHGRSQEFLPGRSYSRKVAG